MGNDRKRSATARVELTDDDEADDTRIMKRRKLHGPVGEVGGIRTRKRSHSDLLESNEGQSEKTYKKQKTAGHRFEGGTHASGSARIHYGDMIVYGNYTAGGGQISTGPESSYASQREVVVMKALVVAGLSLALVEQLLLALINLAVLLTNLPKQIGDQSAIFEDVFGNTARIDARFIQDWTAFEFTICERARTQRRPGLQRIMNLKYRLHDRSREDIIDPRTRINFAAVFLPGRYISMSIVFEQSEITWYETRTCLRCRSSLKSFRSARTRCGNCGFTYDRLRAERVCHQPGCTSRVCSPSRPNRTATPHLNFFQPSAENLDEPKDFHRISIGEQYRPNASEPPSTEVDLQFSASRYPSELHHQLPPDLQASVSGNMPHFHEETQTVLLPINAENPSLEDISFNNAALACLESQARADPSLINMDAMRATQSAVQIFPCTTLGNEVCYGMRDVPAGYTSVNDHLHNKRRTLSDGRRYHWCRKIG